MFMIHATLKELTRALAARELSSRELVSAYLDRIAAVNPTLNAFYFCCRARECLNGGRCGDAARAAGQAGLFTGIPFSA